MDDLHQLPGVEPLSAEQLDEQHDYLASLLDNSPDMSTTQLLKTMQLERGMTTKTKTLQRWLQAMRESGGCRRAPCADIPEAYWWDLLSVAPDMSAADANARLRTDLGLFCYSCDLESFLKTKKKAVAKTAALREAILCYWQTAVELHFGVRSISPYPAYTGLTCPASPFQFWTSMMSWAVCDCCGRKDTSLWKTPTLKDRLWNSVWHHLLKKATWQTVPQGQSIIDTGMSRSWRPG